MSKSHVVKPGSVAAQGKSEVAAPQQPAAPQQAEVAAPPQVAAPAPVVQRRGQAAVQQIKVGAKAFRVQAAHNAAWWKVITEALTAGKGVASVPALVVTPTNPQGVPGRFIAYCLRRQYLAVAEQPAPTEVSAN